MIMFNGRRIETEWMHPEIKSLFWKYNPGEVINGILAREIHPIHCSKGEIAELVGKLEKIEQNLC